MRRLKKYSLHIDTEDKLTVARWKGAGRLGKKAKELKSTNWQLQNSHEDIKYSIRSKVNNIVVTMYGVMWVLDHCAVHLKLI